MYYPIADRKGNSHKLAEHQCFVQKAVNHNKTASVNGGVFHDFKNLNVDDGVIGRERADQGRIDRKAAKLPKIDGDQPEDDFDMGKNNVRKCPSLGQKPLDAHIWVFDIETDQSYGNEGQHKPPLLATESLIGDGKVYLGFDCINKFCGKVFSSTERVRKTERFNAHFGRGFGIDLYILIPISL